MPKLNASTRIVAAHIADDPYRCRDLVESGFSIRLAADCLYSEIRDHRDNAIGLSLTGANLCDVDWKRLVRCLRRPTRPKRESERKDIEP